MKRFAVGQIDWYDNKLTIEIVSADNWQDAWRKHTHCMFDPNEPIPNDIEEAKQECFNRDGMMESTEIQ